MLTEKVYILNGARSYIGMENGMYRHIPAEKLGAAVLKPVLEPVAETDIDLVIAGNAVGAGGNLTRLMMLEAGVGCAVPCCTVDMQCSSGMEGIALAVAKIKSGQADLVAAGGFESSSTAPRRAYHKNHPDYEQYGGEGGWYKVSKFVPGEHRADAMLVGAERTAVSEGISRQEMNPWVLRSHRMAVKARDEGVLQDILVPAEEGCCQDEGIRDRISERLLDRLPCILPQGQAITAGNACLTHDGAAFVLLGSERYVKERWLESGQGMPRAEVIDAVEVGVEPDKSPLAAIAAVEKLLWRNNLEERDIHIFECNEAFAVIDVLFGRRYPSSVEKYNIFGGALAYGHPYGASGGIIALHAIRALEKTGGGLAVCSVAAAGGLGTAILLRNCR